MVEAALQAAYPNCRLRPAAQPVGVPPAVLRLKKHAEFIKRVKALDHFEREREPPMNRLLTVMGACGEPAFVQIAMTPTPALFEPFAKHLYKRHEARLSRERREHLLVRDRSMVEDAELRGGLEVQHRPLFFVDLRVDRPASRGLRADRLRAARRGGREPARRARNRGAPRPARALRPPRAARRGQSAAVVSQGRVRVDRAGAHLAAAVDRLPDRPVRAHRPAAGAGAACDPATARRPGTLRDALGAVSIHPELRKQNTAVPGTVEQGKSSFLVATVAEDLRRERCAVIVLDPKGDAAEAAVSLVPAERTCTLLDLAHPTCGFNPLAVDAPADVIADYVVAALKNLFTDADIRASSDRYLRNAIIAVLAYDRDSHAVGRRAPAVGRRGGIRVSEQRRRARARAARVQGDLRVLHRRADRAARGRAQHDDRQARRPREQARAAAQLAVDQARAAQRLAEGRLRPRDRRRRGARRQGRARRDGRGKHLRADAAARRACSTRRSLASRISCPPSGAWPSR